ncbi:hypothetical protein ACOME3_005809 [Neoechinorhynchus agilis]
MFTFLLPPEANEKIALSVTTLLSLIIYLQILTEHLPRANRLPGVLTIYCNLAFFLVICTSLSSVMILHLYYSSPLGLRNPLAKCCGRGCTKRPGSNRCRLARKRYPPSSASQSVISNRRNLKRRTVAVNRRRLQLTGTLESPSLVSTSFDVEDEQSMLPLEVLRTKQSLRSLMGRIQHREILNESAKEDKIRSWKKRILVFDRALFIFFAFMLTCIFLYFTILVNFYATNSTGTDAELMITNENGLVKEKKTLQCLP